MKKSNKKALMGALASAMEECSATTADVCDALRKLEVERLKKVLEESGGEVDIIGKCEVQVYTAKDGDWDSGEYAYLEQCDVRHVYLQDNRIIGVEFRAVIDDYYGERKFEDDTNFENVLLEDMGKVIAAVEKSVKQTARGLSASKETGILAV